MSWDLQAAPRLGDQTPIRGGTPNRLSVFFFQWVVHRNLPGSCTQRKVQTKPPSLEPDPSLKHNLGEKTKAEQGDEGTAAAPLHFAVGWMLTGKHTAGQHPCRAHQTSPWLSWARRVPGESTPAKQR